MGEMMRDFTYIVQETRTLGEFGVATEFRSKDSGDIGNFPGMLQKVLPIGRTVLHAADKLDEFNIEPVDAEVDAGPLAGLQDLILELTAHLGDDLFDSRRMYPAIHDKLVQRKTGNFAAHGIEGAQHDGVGGIVNYDFNSCSRLEGADIPAFSSNDASLDLIAFDGESGNRVLYGSFRCRTLYSIDYYALGFLGSIQTGLVHGVVDIGLCSRAGLRLHVLHEHVAGLLGCHSCNGFKLLVSLGHKPVTFFLLAFKLFALGVQLALCGIELMLSAPEFARLLAKLAFFLAHCVFTFLQLLVASCDIFFVIGLHLDVFLLGLENLLLLDVLGIDFSLLKNRVGTPPGYQAAYRYVDCQCHYGTDNRQNQIHYVHIFKLNRFQTKQHPHMVQMLSYMGR